MFTGIISGVGQIVAAQSPSQAPPVPAGLPAHPFGLHVTLRVPAGFLSDVQLGDSIAVNGACMTVCTLPVESHTFGFDLSAESLDKTTGLSAPGPVNLEKALRAHDRLGGHLVSGHVDGVGSVVAIAAVGESWHLQLLVPSAIAKYLAYKGAITVNGVSLTVNQISDSPRGTLTSINLIPHTMQHTTLGLLRAGDQVNLEVDLIARYVERMLTAPTTAP